METKLYEKGEFGVRVEGTDILLDIDTKGVDISVKVDAEYFLKELAETIPGEIDDSVIALLVNAFK